MRMFRLILAVAIIWSLTAQASAARAESRILVSAAASLSDAFRMIGAEFMADNPGVKVEFNFAASGTLLQQMELGAPVDVFASADMRTMELAKDKGLVLKKSVEPFAANSVVIITPAGSRTRSGGPRWLMSAQVARLAVGNPRTVPAGRYAEGALIAAGVWDAVKDKLVLAENVRQVLDYVRRGEVDAGIVYATDAAVAKDDVSIAARLESATPVIYPAAVAKDSVDMAAATRFVSYLKGGKSAAILKRFGFGKAVR
jgi:molybdate transport system substrate-binding protein